MTPKEYFKKFPHANEAWQVGSEIFHAAYHNSAQQYAAVNKQKLVRIERKAVPDAVPAESKPEQSDAQ